MRGKGRSHIDENLVIGDIIHLHQREAMIVEVVLALGHGPDLDPDPHVETFASLS